MLNPNLIVMLFFLWMVLFLLLQDVRRMMERKSGVVYQPQDYLKSWWAEFWIYLGVGVLLYILLVVVWLWS